MFLGAGPSQLRVNHLQEAATNEAYKKMIRTAYELALHPNLPISNFEVLITCQQMYGVTLMEKITTKGQSVHASHMTLLIQLMSTCEWVLEIISNYHFWLWLRVSMPRKWFIAMLLSCIEYWWKMRFVLRFLKRWLNAKTLIVFFQLASACETCEWGSEISSKLFQNRRFFVFNWKPSHLTLFMKSQLATNKEYIPNRYHNRFFEPRNHK